MCIQLLMTRYKFEPLLFNSLYYFCNLRSIWASSRVCVDFSSVEDQSHLSLGETTNPPNSPARGTVTLCQGRKLSSKRRRTRSVTQMGGRSCTPKPGLVSSTHPSPTGEPEKWVGRARSTHSHPVSLNRMGQITPKTFAHFELLEDAE